MKNFELVAIYTFPSEYAVLRLLLQQENIQHHFQNETMISVLPFHSNAVGGIRLWVHHQDVDKAKEIIFKFENPDHLRIV